MPKFKTGLDIEKLMKLRTGTGESHLDPASFDEILGEMIDLKKKLIVQENVIQELAEDAMSDPLTGLANRRTFDKELQRSLLNSRRYGRMNGLLLLDVDNFKSVNDKLGHTTGDNVLKHVASLLRQNTRATDINARIGGDEFCVILNELKSTKNAEQRAGAIMNIISKTPCIGEEKTVHVSVSVGYYVFGADDEPETIMQRADESMYSQKSKNKTEIA